MSRPYKPLADTREEEIEIFYDAWVGRSTLTKGGVCWEATHEWLSGMESRQRLLALMSCMLIFDKPNHYLFAGRTKDPNTGGYKFDGREAAKGSVLAQFLPHYTTKQIEEADSDLSTSINMRKGRWHPDLVHLNASLANRVALIIMQFCTKPDGPGKFPEKNSILAHFIFHDKDPKPMEMTKETCINVKTNAETHKIRWSSVSRFQGEKPYWNRFDWVSILRTCNLT